MTMEITIYPKVTVCVVTYNQEKYIGQCLKSLVEQKTTFEFVVIVSDDCSTDETRSIIKGFAKDYPNIIRPIFHKKNIGASNNFVFVHNLSRGDYTAHMDGDDYALPNKLQAQADYLDANPKCSVVWHRMNVFDDANSFCVPNLPNLDVFDDGKVYLADMLEFGSICFHSSTMYRTQTRKTRKIKGKVIDWYYYVEFLISGYGKYLESILGGYRYNAYTGITRVDNGRSQVQIQYISHIRHYLYLLPQYRKNIFINCILHFLIELKNLRVTAFSFLELAWESKVRIDVNTLIAASIKFRRIHPRIL